MASCRHPLKVGLLLQAGDGGWRMCDDCRPSCALESSLFLAPLLPLGLCVAVSTLALPFSHVLAVALP